MVNCDLVGSLKKSYIKAKDTYDFKNKKRFNSPSMIFITTLLKELNELLTKYSEVKNYLESIKNWKKFIEKELAPRYKNEETKIGGENNLLGGAQARDKYQIALNA